MPSIRLLKAAHGDSFIINCERSNNYGVIVVDGGPKNRKNQIIKELSSFSHINLMILTHYDDDHIAGLVEYTKRHRNDEIFPVDNLWVNCAREIDFDFKTNLSYAQAASLADYLSSAKNLTNTRWSSYIKYDNSTIEFPFALITILTPIEIVQQANKKEFESAITDLSGSKHYNKDINVSLEKLAERPKVQPNMNNLSHLVNRSSISFILDTNSLRLLMLGDSYPQDVYDSLKKLGYNQQNKLKIDYVKVSHHGSKNNTSNELLDIIECKNFIISTNGGYGRSFHPDRECLANILCHTGRNMSEKVHFFFNYPLSVIEEKCGKMFNEGEADKYNFEISENVEVIK